MNMFRTTFFIYTLLIIASASHLSPTADEYLNFPEHQIHTTQLPCLTTIKEIATQERNQKTDLWEEVQKPYFVLHEQEQRQKLLQQHTQSLAELTPHLIRAGINVADLINHLCSTITSLIKTTGHFESSYRHLAATEPLAWCLGNCDMCPLPMQRLELVIKQIDAIIAAHPCKEEVFTHCSCAEQGMLQPFLLAKALTFVGYKNLQFIIIGDEIYKTARSAERYFLEQIISNEHVTCETFLYTSNDGYSIDIITHKSTPSLKAHSFDLVDPGYTDAANLKDFSSAFINATKATEQPIIFSLLSQQAGIRSYLLVARA